jgi:hypothetical protein
MEHQPTSEQATQGIKFFLFHQEAQTQDLARLDLASVASVSSFQIQALGSPIFSISFFISFLSIWLIFAYPVDRFLYELDNK